MATHTLNYDLKKPAPDDFYNVADQNENMDKIDEALKGVSEELTSHKIDDVRHTSENEREKWNNEFATHRTNKDDHSTFQIVEKRREDGTLFATSVFSAPDENGNYLMRTYTEYDAVGTTALKTIIFDIIYDENGDWIDEVIRSD